MTTWELRVRYHECDQQGIAFNATYFAWADMGSFEFWKTAYGGYQRLVDAGLENVVVAAEGSFRRPARFDDLLHATTDVATIGRTSFALATRFDRDGDEVATITVRYVFVGLDLEGATPPPDEIAAALRRAAGGDRAD